MRLLLAGLTVASGACHHATASTSHAPSGALPKLPTEPGVVATSGQETCISFGDVNGVGVETDLATGTQVFVIIPGDHENVIIEATARGPCADDGSGTKRHLLAIPSRDPFIGIGIVGRPAVHITGAKITADIDRDGTPEEFEVCTSSEGVHLTIWSNGVRRWHAYHYLGYDVEPTCSEGETRP